MHLLRKTTIEVSYPTNDAEKMIQNISDNARNNLEKTILNLNHDLLYEISFYLGRAKHVLIVGDTHEINDFYPLQLDLLGMGISCRIINASQTEKIHYMDLEKEDVLLYLNISKDWKQQPIEPIFKELLKKGVLIYSFTQEEGSLAALSTKEYIYGCENSNNSGYVSLPLLNDIISSYIYMV
jgi:DNA-binding MurR/RpiR family transcriptional regulator